jgi:glycosyltransferase involved in cell wall biosynthesis
VQVPFVRGGAEVLAEELVSQLRMARHDSELVAIPFSWGPPLKILDQMLMCRLLDLSEAAGRTVDLMIGLKFPAYLARNPNKVLWLLHQHRSAYDLWGSDVYGDLHKSPDGRLVRDAIRSADNQLIPEARRVFTISRKVTDRLAHFNALKSEPLYHPPRDEDRYHAAEAADYFLVPSRLNPTKRQGLAIEALRLCRETVRLKMLGPSENDAYDHQLRSLADRLGVADRIEWLGSVSQADKIAAYAHALGIVFLPFDEDYGYVTLEAMLARKPVVTCVDSGGPLEFVVHGDTGLVVDPSPAALASALDRLWSSRTEARQLGENGRARYGDMRIGWTTAIGRLTSGP